MLVHANYLSPDTKNQLDPQTYHYVKFFEGQVVYMPFNAICNHIWSITDQTNASMPFVVTAYPALLTATANHMPLYHKMPGVNLVSMNCLCIMSLQMIIL